MSKVSVQWLTQDKDLFEFDWLTSLLEGTTDQVLVADNVSQLQLDKKVLLICNHAVPYRPFLDALRQNNSSYGIILLSDENLLEPCEWLHDPACKFLFRNYLHPLYIRHPKVTVFGLGYKRNFLTHCLTIPVEERSTLWSFAGTPHGERSVVLDMFKDLKPNEVHACSGFGADDGISTEDYVSMLNDSQFALCLLGQESADTFRLYEALEAGCIPVTINRSNQFDIRPSYWHGVFYGETDLPFIAEDSWEKAKEKMIHIIENNETAAVQKNCTEFWNKWKTVWRTQLHHNFSKI
jgi:hypothetical protein